MSRALVCLLLAACSHGQSATQAPRPPAKTVPRLMPPPLLDPDVRGSAYLAAVALQLQPGWGQFLDDCRLRLPAAHPLNDMSLAAIADLSVDARGHVVDVHVGTSGNTEFDQAVSDAVREATPLPAPPRDLWSDDDRVHLRWLFARDRRQAGPATAAVTDLELPLASVVDRLTRDHDLARAARRILRAKPDERDTAMHSLAVAALREAIDSSDSTVRRSAVDAVSRVGLPELLPDVRSLLTSTSDTELRLVAIAAVGHLDDRGAAPTVLDELRRDVVEHERLAHAEIAALVALHQDREAAAFLRSVLDGITHPSSIALEGVSLVALPELTKQIDSWLLHGDARTRAAACSALASRPPADAANGVTRCLADRDARVRVAGLRAIHDVKPVRAKVVALAKDRDAAVRARAVELVPGAVTADDMLADPSPEVRAAYAMSIDAPAFFEDRDPDVRAAAWSRHKRQAGETLDSSAYAKDPAPQVREAVIAFVDDDELLAQLARADEDADVRTEALVRLCARRGRDASSDILLTRFAAAAPGSAERVRTMLAWLLAR